MLAGGSLAGSGGAATLDLNGTNLTLPQPGVFGGQTFINGTDNVTNKGTINATLTEGGGPAGTTYSGSITDGPTNTTGLVHTGGTVTILNANTYSGGTTIEGGTIGIANTGALGSGTVTFASPGPGTLQSTVTGTLANGIAWSAGVTGTVSATTGQTLTLGGNLALGDKAVAQFGSATDTGTVVVNSSSASIFFSAALAVNGGTLRAGSFILPFLTSAASSTTVASGATLDFNDLSGSIRNLQGAGTVLTGVNAATVLGIASGNFSGSIQGAGGIRVTDAIGTLNGTLTLSGTSTYTGTTTIDAGHTLEIASGGALGTAVSHTSLLTNGGTLTVDNGGTLWATNVTNNGTFTNNGTVHDDLNNNGTVNNNGSFNGNVATNTGTINNNNGGIWTGDVVTNAGAINNNQGATWNGNVRANTGTIANKQGATWNGNATNSVGGTLTNAGTWKGDANNAGTLTNSGTWTTTSAGFTNSGTLTTSGTLDATNGGLTNTGTVNANGGAINGAIANNAGGTFNVNGTVTSNSTFANASGAALAVNGGGKYTISGLVTNGGTVTVASLGTLTANAGIANSGTITNNGTVNADVGNTGTITNNNTWNGNLLSNTGAVTNNSGATWTGNATNNVGGTLTNAGTWTGDAHNDGTVTNSGTWTTTLFGFTNFGTLTTTGTLDVTQGKLINEGTVNAAGLINGSITNGGTFTVTGGNLQGNSTFANIGTLNVTGGNFTGITTLTNDPTGSVNIGAGFTLGANAVTNAAGGTISDSGHFNIATTLTNSGTVTVNAGGTMTAGNVINNAGGVILNNGTVTDMLNNSGTVTNNGTYNADVNNTGAVALITNSATGTWNGNLLSNTGGATVNNAGTWNGDANNASIVNNSGTWTTTSAGFTNSGTLNTIGTIDATKGGLANTGTVNAAGGAVNGAITNDTGGHFFVTGTVTSNGTFNNSTATSVLAITDTGNYTLAGPLTNAGTVAVGAGTGGSLSVTNGITSSGTIVVAAKATVKASLSNTGSVGNAGTWTGDATNAGTIMNSGTWTTTSAGFTNSGTLVTTGTLDATNGGLANTGMVGASGHVMGAITNSGGFLVTGTLMGNSTFANNSGGILEVDGNSFTGITTLTNANGGVISLAGGTIGDITTNNSGLVVATGISTISGTFNNLATGVVDLTQGATTANQLKTGSFNAQSGSAVNVLFDAHTANGATADQLIANGTSGTVRINFADVTAGTQVVLGSAINVIKDNTLSGSLQVSGGCEAFGLINVCAQSDHHGGAELARTLNLGATAAPGASVMAALSAIDTSFHQSTAPFVASPQSDDPNKWTGGVWSRATGGQTTTKLTAFESFGGTSAPLRVKTNFDAYEVGVDTGILNFGGSGWNGHFGIMGGAVTATANEVLSGSGTSVKFDVPFAGVYGVFTHGPFFMDLEARHDWVDTHVTNVTANLNNTQLKGHGDSVSGSAGYHFDLVNNWFIEPTAGFGLTQTQFDTLATNVGQSAQGIAAGTVSFDSIFSMLVHGGARVGTSFVVADTLALQPFGTLSAWRELGGQSSAAFANGGVSDPLSLSRVGTFYQAGLGLSAQLLNTGLIGFARGDIRWGDNLNGASVVGGLRYSFGP